MAKVPGSHIKGALLALLAFGVYSTHDVAAKFLGGIYSPMQIIFFVTLFTFPLVTFMMMSDPTDGNLRPRHPWWMAIRSLVGLLNSMAVFYAFSVLPFAQAVALFFTMPLLVTVLSIPILGEKVGVRRGIAVVVGLLGVLIVLRPGTVAFGLGQAAALTGAATGAFVAVVIRKIGSDERASALFLYPMMVNLVAMAVVLPFVYTPIAINHLGILALMAALGMAGGMAGLYAYRLAPAIIVAPMQYSQIIWAVVFGALFFGERADLYTLLGTLVIMASGLYIVLRESTPDVSENQPVLESRARPVGGMLPRLSNMLKRR